MPGHTFRERELVQNLEKAFELFNEDQIIRIYRNYPIPTQMVVRRIIKQVKKCESASLAFNHADKRKAIQDHVQDFLTSVAVFTI